MKRCVTRRRFLGGATAAALGAWAAPVVIPERAWAGANQRLNVALLACGGRAAQLVPNILNSGENIVALCDVDARQIAQIKKTFAGKFDGAKVYDDYRKLLDEEKTVEGVVISAGQRWHVPMSKRALEAGKHVFCEKPLAHSVAEARQIGQLAQQFTALVTEIAEKREAEEKRHREEITHIDRLATIGELLSGLAHEIRNPIAGISAAIQSLSRGVPAGDPLLPVYQEIRNNIDRLDTLVKSLLAYARMETPKKIPVDINGIIAQSLIIFQSQTANGVTIRQNLADGLPWIDGDPKLLQQVLLNVFINAYQAKGPGLELDITTCYIPKNLIVREMPDVLENNPFRCQYGVIQVRIADNGPGIPPHLLRDIFRPFVTTKPSGTGLGLSISTRIVREHSGCLFAKNNPTQGTTIVMCLPAEQPTDTQP